MNPSLDDIEIVKNICHSKLSAFNSACDKIENNPEVLTQINNLLSANDGMNKMIQIEKYLIALSEKSNKTKDALYSDLNKAFKGTKYKWK